MSAFWTWLKSLFKKEDPKVVPEMDQPHPTGPEVDVATLPSRPSFFGVVRKRFGPLRQSQVDGFNFVLNAMEKEFLPPQYKAYMLATVWHETARTMQPIKEMGGEKYLKSKKYYPYYGRGYVQLTWEYNYKKYLIASHPEKALEPQIAAHVMIDGMLHGVFTGKKLADYFPANGKADPIGARRIINGTDRAEMISAYYAIFLEALK